MKLFNKTSGNEVDEFARELVEHIAAKYPPNVDADANKLRVEKKISRALEEAFKLAVNFRSEKKLGVYKKARLSNTFRWELQQKGYTQAFVELATEGLIVYLTREVKDVDQAKTK